MKKILCNKYEVLKPIAEGGMGSVYLVKDLHLNKLAAVKVSKNPESRQEKETVFREMEVLRHLSHPALPRVIDFFEEWGNLCLVLEYVEGITLEQYLRKFGRVEADRAVSWAIALTEVLGYLHDRRPSVIYRDLKPSNIMIQPDGQIKLIDFGTAFIASHGQEKEQMLMGTPGYSAPEQWQKGCTGIESDIYALGAVLHQMLTGISPGQIRFERRPVREYDKSIARELEKIIIICTRKRPGERYASMRRLREELLHYKEKGRRKAIHFHLKKGIGMILWLAAIGKGVLPFLEGVEAQNFPFPYLKRPLILLGMALLYQCLFGRRYGRIGGIFNRRRLERMVCKQEKSIFLTEKKFSGIYITGIMILLFFSTLFWESMLGVSILAAEGNKTLWVDMRDEQNRKLLLKEEAIYSVTDRVRLEIPLEKFPEQKIALQLIATGEEGKTYQSRVFLLEGNPSPDISSGL